MRNFKYIIAVLFFISCIACNKKLDVQPQNSVTDIENGDDVKALLFGGYKLLQNASAFGEQYIFIADLLASENQVDFVGTFTNYKDLSNKNQTKETAIATSIWQNSYLIIQNMNIVLDKLDLLDESERDAVAAEAKFMRGVAYFELVNFFAKPYSAGNTASADGVPIVLQPTYLYDPAKNKPGRSSVEEVYQQVIADLTDAANGLDVTSTNTRATKYSAQAFSARVYLNMADYANAATMANEVIKGPFRLTSTYNQAFNNPSNSQEDVFGIQNTSQSNAGTTDNGIVTFYKFAYDADGNNAGGRGDAQVNQGYFDLFINEPDDFRANYYAEGYSISGVGGIYALKWSTFYRVVPVIRLAEMYLTRGEANLRKGGAPIGNVRPVDDINEVRRRSNASELQTVTGQIFVNERFRELGFEGDRLWTIKRLKLNSGDYAYDDPKLVLPIPQREIDVNENLTQNEGY